MAHTSNQSDRRIDLGLDRFVVVTAIGQCHDRDSVCGRNTHFVLAGEDSIALLLFDRSRRGIATGVAADCFGILLTNSTRATPSVRSNG